MSDSAKEKFLKKRALSESEQSKVTGGGAIFYSTTGRYKIRCTNPDCYYNMDTQLTEFSEENGGECSECHQGIVTFEYDPY